MRLGLADAAAKVDDKDVFCGFAGRLLSLLAGGRNR
jgi:hypothetical protein